MKILILGVVASGKTTLAKRMSVENNINYYEIDSIIKDYKNGLRRTDEEQQEEIERINSQPSWIIAVNLSDNMYNLLKLADIIIYLDTPLHVRKRRLFYRFIKQKLKIEECDYKPNIKTLREEYKETDEAERYKDRLKNELLRYAQKVFVLRDADQMI